MSFKTQVYELVGRIPPGRVLTYGSIARALGHPTWSREVGWILHQNKDPKIPCHRVVDRNGRLAPTFAFDGWRKHQGRLLAEGVEFRDEMHVDLKKCQWFPF